MNNMPNKPITVAKEDFISGLNSLIENSELPVIILEPIFKDLYNQLSVILKQQTDDDRLQYMNSLSTIQEEQNCESVEQVVD